MTYTGTVYEGNWSNNVHHGHGEEKWADGTHFKGEFQNGMKHG